MALVALDWAAIGLSALLFVTETLRMRINSRFPSGFVAVDEGD